MKHFLLFFSFLLLLTTFVFSSEYVLPSSHAEYSSLDGLQIQLVTDRGNVFTISAKELISIIDGDSSADNNSNSTSILDGLGVYTRILNVNTNGQVYFGSGDNIGSQTDIRQYVEVGSNDDWAIVVTDDDVHETLFVPEFGREYMYNSGALVDITSNAPNILGYSESRSLSGNINILTDADGISFLGTGEEILKLHDYDGQSMLLRGDGTADNIIKIITSDQDLINDAYDSTLGYLTYSANIDPGTNSFSVEAGIDSTHIGIIDYDFELYYNNAYSPGGGHITCHLDVSSWIGFDIDGTFTGGSTCFYEASWSMVTNLVKTNQLDHHTITGDSTTPKVLSELMPNPGYFNESTSNYSFKLYDTLPSTQKTGFTVGPLEQVLDFTSDQTYIYVNYVVDLAT